MVITGLARWLRVRLAAPGGVYFRSKFEPPDQILRPYRTQICSVCAARPCSVARHAVLLARSCEQWRKCVSKKNHSNRLQIDFFRLEKHSSFSRFRKRGGAAMRALIRERRRFPQRDSLCACIRRSFALVDLQETCSGPQGRLVVAVDAAFGRF